MEDSPLKDILYLPEKQIDKIVTFLNLTVAMIFLVLATWILWIVEVRTKLFPLRLAILTIFVLFFAIYIGYLTSAKRSEVFAATAAYAAVLVVFLGSQ